MTSAQLLNKMAAALAADAPLADWCQAEFGRAPAIFAGIDDAEPPGQEDYPFVAILGVDQDRGIGKAEVVWTVEISVAVLNAAIEINGNIRTRKGLLQVEALRELTENAFYRTRILPAQSSGVAASFCDHPLYVSFTSITFKALRPPVMP